MTLILETTSKPQGSQSTPYLEQKKRELAERKAKDGGEETMNFFSAFAKAIGHTTTPEPEEESTGFNFIAAAFNAGLPDGHPLKRKR
ncbi:hypothetical protein GXB81_18265 [Paraburkholderia sp. Ac-20336]|uniref:hypothetical protein n=1 Tax=Paraburkholderia sp. Ac-20336 TaxID=2703886 RepID=UPI001981FE0E|nr:hypothetical protein [Paraburkholderia sp. Ac-20336]MBN3804980.1 hypothetical protein [Paraburkholderia sp. Ac-20336]